MGDGEKELEGWVMEDELDVDWGKTGSEGAKVEGIGREATSVLMSYANHVATRVWAGEVIICLIISYLNNYLSFYLN